MNPIQVDQKKKRRLYTFEPDSDVNELLEKAKTAGLPLGEILNEAMRICGPKVIMKIAENRARALKALSFNYTRGLALGVAA